MKGRSAIERRAPPFGGFVALGRGAAVLHCRAECAKKEHGFGEREPTTPRAQICRRESTGRAVKRDPEYTTVNLTFSEVMSRLAGRIKKFQFNPI